MSELIWYHGKISKAEAVRRFRQFHPDGSYLVRESETVRDAYTLSIGFQSHVYHYRIIPNPDSRHGYTFEGKDFYSISQLVNFHRKHQGSLVTLLKHPILPPLPSELGDTQLYDNVTGNERDRTYENPMTYI